MSRCRNAHLLGGLDMAEGGQERDFTRPYFWVLDSPPIRASGAMGTSSQVEAVQGPSTVLV